MIKQKQYSVVEKSYALAFFRAAREQGILQRVQEECKVLLNIVRADGISRTRLLIFMENPRVATESKLDLLDNVFKGRLGPILMKLLKLVVLRDRVLHLGEILEYFLRLVEEAEGIHQARVESAAELNFQEKLQLKNALEKFTGARLRIDYSVDPALIGGLIFRYKDVLIDSSLKNELDVVRRRLGATQVPKSAA